jgi:hypothetical protein
MSRAFLTCHLLQLIPCLVYSSTLKMEATCSSAMPVKFLTDYTTSYPRIWNFYLTRFYEPNFLCFLSFPGKRTFDQFIKTFLNQIMIQFSTFIPRSLYAYFMPIEIFLVQGYLQSFKFCNCQDKKRNLSHLTVYKETDTVPNLSSLITIFGQVKSW